MIQNVIILYFPLLAIPILLLLHFAGPLSAAGLTICSTIIGTIGFIFTAGEVFSGVTWAQRLVPFVFLGQIAWLWTLFWVAEKLIESKDLEVHRLQEEQEKLELQKLDYQQMRKDFEKTSGGLKERILRYNQLRAFTDDLAATLRLRDVQAQTEQSVQKIFAGDGDVRTKLYLFPFPNSPGENDAVGEWIVRHRIPLLIADANQDVRFPHPKFKKAGSLIASPIERESLVVGTLTVESDRPRRWKDEDLRFLSDISNIISIAVANAVYYEKVESLAVRDSLTGLFVRYRFDERVEEEFSRAKVSGSPLSLILFDLDRFKAVNDQWGHPAGDKALKAVCDAILNQVRETDFCARYGGEEVAVLMPLTSLEHAFHIGERIRRHIEKMTVGPEKIHLTVSGGVASLTPQTRTIRDFVNSADEALYEAKQSGRNRLIKAPQ